MQYNADYPKNYYDSFGEREWLRLDKNRLGELLYHVHLDILTGHITTNDDVIELGAGAGRFTKELVHMAKSLVTSDISQVQLELNRAKMKELGLYDRIRGFHILDISRMPEISNESFNVAICVGGPINYLFDKKKEAIHEMLRIIKPGGKLILGSISRIGALIYHMKGYIKEKHLFGIAATQWLMETGIQDPEHYPVENGHYMQMMTSAEIESLFRGENVEIIEQSAAGLLAQSGEENMNAAKEDPELWNLLIQKELELTKLPGTLECGTHMIYVIQKQK